MASVIRLYNCSFIHGYGCLNTSISLLGASSMVEKSTSSTGACDGSI